MNHKINANGLKYWVLTNGENSVMFRETEHKQKNIIHIDGWPMDNADSNGKWQIRQARNMWNELIRIGFIIDE
tara:strand:+ start:2459 stop:2677 length:219 start_codon:yes stop_codon:yes gene_type:complete